MNQHFQIVLIGPGFDNADGNGDRRPPLTPLKRQRQVGDRSMQTLCDRQSVTQGGIRQCDHELFAAETRDQIMGTQ